MIKLMPTPRSVDVEITSRCNARCRYCYYLNNEGVDYEDLPTQKWLDFFQELGRAKVMYVCVAGGEPFVRQDIFDLFEGIKENRMRFQVLTNGRLVTRAVAQRLRETGRIYSIQVSLDGSTAGVHESLRGRGSFEPALQAIRILTEEGLPLTVRVTVHAGNIDDLPAISRLLLEEYRLPSFSTNTISALGTKSKYEEGIFLSPSQRLKAMKILAELEARYPGRILADAGPLAEWKMFQEMEKARAEGKALRGRGRLVGCNCVFQRLSVRADGAYVPCVMLPQVVLGWIGRDRIEDIWLRSPVLRGMRKRQDQLLSSFDECQGCEYSDSCTGNCPGTAYSLVGEINRPSPEGCLRRFKRDLAAEGMTL